MTLVRLAARPEISVRVASIDRQPRQLRAWTPFRGRVQAEAPRSRRSLVLVLQVDTAPPRYRLLIGADTVFSAAQSRLAYVPGIILEDVSAPAAKAFSAWEELQEPRWDVVLSTVSALRECGLPDPQSALLLGTSAAEICRLRAIAGDPFLAEAFGAGRVSLGHARQLLATPDSVRAQLLQECRDRRLTTRELSSLIAKVTAPAAAEAIDARPRKDPDTLRYEAALTDVLGCAVSIDGTSEPSITFEWHTVDDLIGLLGALGATATAGANEEGGCPSRARKLSIPLLSNDELFQLVGHLGASD